MYPRLRGHHLICLQFYRGEGYSEEFIENLENVLEKARQSGVLIVEGADDICKACPYLVDGKCSYKENAEEEIRYLDFLALTLLGLSSERTVSWKEISERVVDIIDEWKDKACRDCEWRKVCHVDDL